jgi:hypothetical protein
MSSVAAAAAFRGGGMVQTTMDPQRSRLVSQLKADGYVCVAPAIACAALQLDLTALDAVRETWERLPRDTFLRDAGQYRSRRHSCYVQTLASADLAALPRRAHWQPTAYNALHGGLQRWFEPIEPVLARSPAWQHLLRSLGELFAELQPVERWYIEAHQFRIDTAGGIGRPTPEGAHRDGVDFVALVLVGRHAVRGGETRVFDAQGTRGVRFTMEEPWSMLLMDDARVIHETTPIQSDTKDGVRDTLVLTYRAQGFQEP